MPRYDDPDEPFYLGEVIGGAVSYHQPTCYFVSQIRPRNYKRLRDWHEALSLGLRPCPHCRPPPAIESDLRPAERAPLTASELGDLRRALMTLLKTMDRGGQVCPGKDGPAALIDCLSKAKVIPRDVAACMRTITEMRNAAEYEEKVSKARSFAVEAALQVIREWADVSEITLPDGLKV